MKIVDGRATRWEAHNAERRRELVASALRAIRTHGSLVGMDEIAATAGTSKTVIYRHFNDRTGLYLAIVEWVHEFIRTHLPLTHASSVEPADLVQRLADAYLSLVEKDPEIYQFVITRPVGDQPMNDPVHGITTRIGNEVSAAFSAWLAAHRLDTTPANIWGHGVVGFIYAVADRWIITKLRRPRADVVAYINAFFRPSFDAHRSPR